jgi:hypothetical protein
MKYPIYARSTTVDYIVEFTSISTGKVVIVNAHCGHTVGFETDGWFDHTNSDAWEIISKEDRPELFI